MVVGHGLDTMVHFLKTLLGLLRFVLQILLFLDRIVYLVLQITQLGLLLEDGPIFLLEICLELRDLLLKLGELVLIVVVAELLAAALGVSVAHEGIVGLGPWNLKRVLAGEGVSHASDGCEGFGDTRAHIVFFHKDGSVVRLQEVAQVLHEAEGFCYLLGKDALE